MTADPVTAAVLAEAVREATKSIRFDGSVFTDISYGHRLSPDNALIHVGLCGQDADRWQGILDRYDAQVRDDLNSWIVGRNGYMANARSAKWADAPITASLEVAKARAANHRALRLRRQLRALGAKP